MKRVRVGNGCGFWGDNLDAPILLAEAGRLDYLTLEYLAELTMSILALQKQRDPETGYAGDFLDVLERLGPILQNRPRLLLPKALSCGRIEMLVAGRPLDPIELPNDRQHLRTRERRRRHHLLEVASGVRHAADFDDRGRLRENVVIGGRRIHLEITPAPVVPSRWDALAGTACTTPCWQRPQAYFGRTYSRITNDAGT